METKKFTTSKSWWEKAIIYQIYPRSFKDSTGNGIGDLQGIISKLDYLDWLGINAIWISPFYPSPMRDFGYDISNFTDVDRIFGTLEDFDQLIEEAHKRNLRIIIDYVPNHTSEEHPWFRDSRSSRTNSKRNWYIWKERTSENKPPNNWQSIPGGSVWTYDEKTQQCYLHSFLSCQPDLNWRNPAVKEAMFDVLRFWLDRGVDGFRIDMLSWLMKDSQFRDEPPNPDYNPSKNSIYDKNMHLYSRGGPGLLELFQEIRNVVNAYGLDRVLVGEVDYYLPIDQYSRYYESGISIPLNFRFITEPWFISSIKSTIKEFEDKEPIFVNYQLGNHDQPRIASRIGYKKAKMAAMLLLTLRGTLFMYYGDEIGLMDVNIPRDKIMDPIEITNPGKGRDPARTPMQWTQTRNAGFSTGIPWLPISENYRETNVLVERKDPKSYLNLYRSLITIRNEDPALLDGKLVFLNESISEVLCYYRIKNKRLLVALNFSDSDQTLQFPFLKRSKILLSTFMDRHEYLNSDTFLLRGNEGCIISIS